MAIVESGDWVVDHMDDDRMRKVSHIQDTSVYMEDGGVMGLEEIGRDDVFLPGEITGYN